MLVIGSGCGLRKAVTAPVRGTATILKKTGSGVSGAVRKTGSTVANVAKKANPVVGLRERNTEAEYNYDFVIEVGGKRRTEGAAVKSMTTYSGMRCFLTETKQQTTVLRQGQTFTRKVSRRVISGPRQEALFSQDVTNEAGTQVVQTVTIRDGMATFESYGSASGSKRKELKVPDDIIFSIDAGWLAAQKLEPGVTLKAKVLNRRQWRVLNETATVLRMGEVEFQGAPSKVWIVRIDSEDSPDNPVTITLTTEGRLVRMDAKGVCYRVVNRQEVEREDIERYEVITSIPIDFPIIAWDYFDAMALEPLPADAWTKHIMPSEYAQVKANSSPPVLILKKTAPRVPGKLAFPITSTPPGLGAFLQSVGTITPDNPTILRKAQELTRGETDALQAVALLAGWVHYNVKWNARGRLNTSPVETMKQMRGDCSEHSDLFASLARAVGIPTRHCLGLLIQKETALYHNWVEVNLGGSWVPVDTTVNRVGLPAGYLLTARDTTGDNDLRDSLPFTMTQEKLGFKVRSLSKATFTLIPESKKTYAAFDGQWLAHLYWGFAVTKEESWQGKITMKGVELRSPDQQALVKCRGNDFAYRITQSELTSLIKSLQQNLQGCKIEKSDLTVIGRNDVLSIEYSCDSGGKRMRCWQVIFPRRGRSYTVSCWAPAPAFDQHRKSFLQALESIEL
jgi:transglutaminase-like putative cysteine protease